MYLVSPSQFSCHQKCPQLHKFIYEMGFRPKIGSERHFDVGLYFHELAHYLYQLMKAGYKVGDPLLYSAMDTKMRNDIVEVQDDFIGVLTQVHIVFRRYLDRRIEEIDTGIQIVEVEKELKFPIYENAGLHGIVDLLYRSKGRLILRDHKTGENKSAHSDDSVEMDAQLILYACIIWQLFNEVPIVEISWINSKVDYKNGATNDQLFGLYRKTLTKEYLEAFWTYFKDYVYHMQTVPAIRHISSFNCKGCKFRDPCNFELRGLSIKGMLESNYKHVERDYEFRKFTEIARKHSKRDTSSESDSDLDGGWFTINGRSPS
jgi:hypothetical protein